MKRRQNMFALKILAECGIMYKIFRQPDQEVHPWYFGDRAMKRTGLWLKNLPKLKYQLQPDLFNQNVIATKKPEPSKIQIRKKTGQIRKRYWLDANIMDGHERSRFFPVFDPDIPSHLYCRQCLDEFKSKVLKMILGIEKLRNK